MGELARIGGTGTSVTRLGLSSEEQRARDLVGGWLAARGARVHRDPAANLWARFEPPGAGGRGSRSVVGPTWARAPKAAGLVARSGCPAPAGQGSPWSVRRAGSG